MSNSGVLVKDGFLYDEYETCAVCNTETHESDCAVIQLEQGLRVVVCGEECEEAAHFVLGEALALRETLGRWLDGMMAEEG